MNEFLPLYFFLILLSFIKENTAPYFFFTCLFLDVIVYKLPFIHTILGLVFVILNASLPSKNTRRRTLIRNSLNTFFFLFILSILYRKFSFILMITNIFYNLLFTFLLYKRPRLRLQEK